jgi:nicotinamide-nucleotide amidase
MSNSSSQQTLNSMAAAIGVILGSQGLTLTTAESCTGGWIAQTLTAVPGSSGWFDAGFVTYSNAIKHKVLNVPLEFLQGAQAPGAVSEPTVLAMADGALRLAAADWSVATSGIAGPGGAVPGKPVGMVWIAWASARGASAQVFNFSGNRDQVRRQSVAAALAGLLERLENLADLSQ